MTMTWFVCPYDPVAAPGGAPGRRPAMARHIPAVPGPAGEDWDEAEVVGNHCVVKVSAPDAVLDQIRADPEFMEVPTGAAPIPTGRRAAIRTYLTSIGYTLAEVNDANWSPTALLQTLTTAASVLQVVGGVITATAGRRIAPKTVLDIERRLPTPAA